ncbi:MAG TPA: HEAT repeat domain-containing protein, partial [Roseiflexaceae bacterium]|nr:HEAT repeat domain-containing protein [Roseiflexaceae bacterium]
EQLSAADRTLLQLPYFLAHTLEHNTTQLSSAAEAIKAFFEDQGFDSDTLDRMAHAAFDAYKDYHSYKFDVAHFRHAAGEDVYRKLVDEGVLRELPDDSDAQVAQAGSETQAQFDHPLKHDYLAARYLAQNTTEWTPQSLDVVSFESNSFDALAMTLELLHDEAQCDTFIQRVHNWNWAAALVCIAKAVRNRNGRHSQEIQFAVLALVAEKLFDPVQQTRARAAEVLALFPQVIAAPYKEVHDLVELCALVQKQVQYENKYPDRELWFPKWRDLFVRFNSATFNEADLYQIVRQEALVGWTAANVFRRYKLSDLDVRQLRAYYDACTACDFNDWRASTIRSRVAHALGSSDTQSAVTLLLEAINQDRYLWARIGAARSLVEIAAQTSDSALRQHIVDTLIQMVKEASSELLAIKVLHEIGQSAFYRGAHPEWQTAVTPLITLVRDRQNDPERDWWSNLLVEFEKFCQEQPARAVGEST